jgi:guanylate kinase
VKPFPIILSSPSGGGKTTIAKALMARRTDLGYSVSCTTRPPRPGEENGRDYYFLTPGEFVQRRAAGDFAEWAEVHGRLYGTLRSEVERVMSGGQHVMMDIDVQGAELFARAFPQSVLVFVLPPSAEVLLARLRGRSTENAATLVTRLRSALDELAHVGAYEYVVINDDLEHAVQQVSMILDAESLRRTRSDDLGHRVGQLAEQLEHELTLQTGN